MAVLTVVVTHLKFNIAPEKLPSQQESSLPTIIFEGLRWTLRVYNIVFFLYRKRWHVETKFSYKTAKLWLFWKLLVLTGILVLHAWIFFSGFVLGGLVAILGTRLRIRILPFEFVATVLWIGSIYHLYTTYSPCLLGGEKCYLYTTFQGNQKKPLNFWLLETHPSSFCWVFPPPCCFAILQAM